MRKLTLCIVLSIFCCQSYTCASGLDFYCSRQDRIRPLAVKIARDAVRTQLTTGKPPAPPVKLSRILKGRAAVFVTIAKNGRRRGCKGSFEPVTDNLHSEIVRAAIGAATSDVRYRPIRANELDDVTFTVSIVGPLKRVRDPYTFSPRDYGLLLRASSKSGVLLPGEAKTCEWRLSEAKRQAGVRPGEPYDLYVFETVALHENPGAHAKRRK